MKQTGPIPSLEENDTKPNTDQPTKEPSSATAASSASLALIPLPPGASATFAEAFQNLPQGEVASYYQKLQFSFTFYVVSVIPRMLPVMKTDRPWWSTIIPGLKVGAIPIEDWNHGLQLLIDCDHDGKKLGHVFSCCNDFELRGDGLKHTPVPPGFWLHHHVKHTQIKMEDFGGSNIPLAQIRLTLEEMHKSIESGETAYVHCKAGRGRSIVMVICYLMQYLDLPPDAAIELVRSRRREISLSKAQYELIEAYRKEFKTELPPRGTFTNTHQVLVPYGSVQDPAFINTSSWASTIWWFLTYFKPDSIRYNFRLLEQLLMQNFSSALTQLDDTQARALLAGLNGTEPSSSTLLLQYPVFAAGRNARDRKLPKVEELADALEEKLKI